MATRFTKDELLAQMDVNSADKIEAMLDIIDAVIAERATLGYYNASMSREAFVSNHITLESEMTTIINNLTSRSISAIYNPATSANVSTAFIATWEPSAAPDNTPLP